MKRTLNQNEKKMSWDSFMNSSHFGVEIFHPDGYILDMNKRAEEIFECNKEEFIPLRLKLFQVLENVDSLRIAFEQQQEITDEFIFIPILNEGSYLPEEKIKDKPLKRIRYQGFPVFEEGKMIYYIVIATIITEEHKIKEELKLVKQKIGMVEFRTRTLLDSLTQGILYTDPKGRILDMNQSMAHLFNLNRDEFIHSKKDIYDVPFCTKEILKALQQNLTYPTQFWFEANAEKSSDHIFTQRKSTQSTYFEYLGLPVKDNEQLCMGYLCFLTDRTYEKNMIDELQIATERAKQANKMKSAFLANMSHEIRTPLNSIVGFSELLTNYISDQEAMEYVELIRQNNDLLIQIINDVLDLSKLESGNMTIIKEKFCINDILSSIYESLIPKAKRHKHEMKLSQYSQKLMVNLDLNRLRQVIVNFLSNSIKYTPEGGKIELKYYPKDNGIYIEVKDNGIGIAKKNYSRIFQRFEKLNNFSQGTGLGLSICKAITELQDGKIGFQSKEGYGSTFYVWLPTKIENQENPSSQK